MLLRSSVYALLLSVLAGCSSVTHTLGDRRWFNAALPIHLQSAFYEQEASFCAQAADQWGSHSKGDLQLQGCPRDKRITQCEC